MNCIVQALTHTPLLRDYFLSDKHLCLLKDSDKCLVCEMSRLFQEVCINLHVLVAMRSLHVLVTMRSLHVLVAMRSLHVLVTMRSLHMSWNKTNESLWYSSIQESLHHIFHTSCCIWFGPMRATWLDTSNRMLMNSWLKPLTYSIDTAVDWWMEEVEQEVIWLKPLTWVNLMVADRRLLQLMLTIVLTNVIVSLIKSSRVAFNPMSFANPAGQFFFLGQSDLTTILYHRNVSTTIDPFWDISLDLGSSGPGHKPVVVDGHTASSSSCSTSAPKSLIDCLERFTRPEHLGSSAKIKCNTCNINQESIKQLTMKKLPIVACFHLKVVFFWFYD